MIILSTQHLKELVKNNSIECYILINGGLKSSKLIDYDDQKNRFIIYNYIDDTTQRLTEKQLYNESLSNIGKAIKYGALIMD